jgi:hypothetical protein
MGASAQRDLAYASPGICFFVMVVSFCVFFFFFLFTGSRLSSPHAAGIVYVPIRDSAHALWR